MTTLSMLPAEVSTVTSWVAAPGTSVYMSVPGTPDKPPAEAVSTVSFVTPLYFSVMVGLVPPLLAIRYLAHTTTACPAAVVRERVGVRELDTVGAPAGVWNVGRDAGPVEVSTCPEVPLEATGAIALLPEMVATAKEATDEI